MPDSVVKDPSDFRFDPEAPLSRAPRGEAKTRSGLASRGGERESDSLEIGASLESSTENASKEPSAPGPLRGLVELIGIEPTTSALQGRRSPN